MVDEGSAREIVPGRTHLYRGIANQLRERIAAGEFSSGVLLPSELQLASAYGVSRLTVKRALNLLRDEGRLDARRGVGWFVAGTSVRHELNRLSTIQEDLIAAGLRAERHVREFAFVTATPGLRHVLDADELLKITRVDVADGRTMSRVTNWCPADLGQHLSLAEIEKSSLYDLLPVEIATATQVIKAVGATEEDAALFELPVGSPCLQSERTTRSVTGRAVLYGVAVFPGHTAEYAAELRTEGNLASPAVRLSMDESPLDV